MFSTSTSNLFNVSQNSDNSNIFGQNKLNSDNSKKIDILKHNNEDEIDDLKNILNELKAEFKKEINDLTKKLIKNNSNGIYVKCSLHEHILKEHTVHNLKGVYLNGFICDNCGYKQQNIVEKFYHCSDCICSINNVQGGFDLCTTCVQISL